MEGKVATTCCPGEPGGAFCKCGPGWSCVIKKCETTEAAKPFYSCGDVKGCVCITEEKTKGQGSTTKQVVETDGAYCECGDGYCCTINEASGLGKVFLECGNGCKCEIPGSDGVVTLKA